MYPQHDAINNLQSSISNIQYSFQSGQLHANGRTYRRPCDWSEDCGPVDFLGGPRPWTPSARSSLSTLHSSLSTLHSPLFTPLRGMPDDFLVFAVGLEGSVPTVCGLTCAATTLTVRFEDVWHLLPQNLRAFSYTCEVTRDPHSKDAPSAQAEGIVHESIPDLAPDVRICLDLADNGGFVLTFHPTP